MSSCPYFCAQQEFAVLEPERRGPGHDHYTMRIVVVLLMMNSVVPSDRSLADLDLVATGIGEREGGHGVDGVRGTGRRYPVAG